MTESEEYLTAAQAAEMLKCHRGTVNRLIECGRLQAFSVHTTTTRKRWRIPKSAVIALMTAPVVVELKKPDIQPTDKADIVADPFPLLRRFSRKLGKG